MSCIHIDQKICQLQHLHIIKKRNKKKIHTVHVNLNLTDQYGMKIQTVKYPNFVLHGKLTLWILNSYSNSSLYNVKPAKNPQKNPPKN